MAIHPALAELSLAAILGDLARRRPVFHSEADLQQEVAWQVHVANPTIGVRLEVRVPTPSRPGRRERVDVLLHSAQGRVAIELKYPTDRLTATLGEELFDLPRQAAQDITAYNVVKDIYRIEHFVRKGFADAGAVVVVTNDRSYWTHPGHERATAAAAFRLYNGTTLSGSRGWGPMAGAGTMKGREDALELAGAHQLTWRPFSRIPSSPHGEFRALLVEIGH